jgi:hypothetical protein
MNNKSIQIDSDPQVLETLVTALRYYVDSQFPPGSSDCGQVAREELLNLVTALEGSLKSGAPASYSRRMRAMFKEGIRVYFEYLEQVDGFAHTHECELLQSASRNGSATREDLEAAQARDRHEHNTREPE